MAKDTPLYRAAYRVLMELYPPIYCYKIETYEEILRGIKWTAAWAINQPSDVAIAYIAACVDFEKAIRDHWAMHESGIEAEKAYREIVKPPPPAAIDSEESKMLSKQLECWTDLRGS